MANNKELTTFQKYLLASFIFGHWGEISVSGHKTEFEKILGIIKPSTLETIEKLTEG